jgi:hypothetical protein
MLPNTPANLTLANVALIVWLVVDRLLAEALSTSAPRSALAQITARSSLQLFINYLHIF